MITTRQLLRLATRKRLRRAAAAAVGMFCLLAGAVLLVAVLTAPAAAPVIAASAVLGSVAEVFGSNGGEMTGEELAALAEEQGVRCDAAPAADPPPASAAPTTTAAAPGVDPVGDAPATGEDTDPVAVPPIPLGGGGSISREDAQLLLEPLSPGTSSLKAHVWFLYRMAGMGDWAQFTTAYEAAGLSDSEESPDAPLGQVQQLNAAGVGVEKYRLTAAAMVSAGEQTGRFADPYPEYRELVSVELLGSCLSDGPSAERMTLPSPVTTAPPAPPSIPKTIEPLPEGLRPI